jgi:hypothetical protein
LIVSVVVDTLPLPSFTVYVNRSSLHRARRQCPARSH